MLPLLPTGTMLAVIRPVEAPTAQRLLVASPASSALPISLGPHDPGQRCADPADGATGDVARLRRSQPGRPRRPGDGQREADGDRRDGVAGRTPPAGRRHRAGLRARGGTGAGLRASIGPTTGTAAVQSTIGTRQTRGPRWARAMSGGPLPPPADRILDRAVRVRTRHRDRERPAGVRFELGATQSEPAGRTRLYSRAASINSGAGHWNPGSACHGLPARIGCPDARPTRRSDPPGVVSGPSDSWGS